MLAGCLAIAALSSANLLAGCKVGPDYRRPAAPLSQNFKELPGWKLAAPRDDAAKGAWWGPFSDPPLDALERRVEIGNQSLAAAAAAYRNAQALVDEARANLFPALSVAPGIVRSSSGGGFPPGAAVTRTQYSVEASASWELDLWGRIRRQVESSRAAAEASRADLENARLSAQASLATAYVNLRVSDALQSLLRETARNDRRALDIVTNQYAAGVAARSDVLTARAQLDSTESAAVNVGVARAQYEHAIAVLVGVPPSALSIAPGLVPALPDIPDVVPAALLERRPDIAAAERVMQSQNALIGVAVAAYFPVVSLSGVFGFAGDPLSHLFSSANRVWSLGAAASETIFQGGARGAAVAAARANYDASVATYRQTVLTALQQVEDSLAALRILARQAVIQETAVDDARRAADIVLNEYQAGTQAYTAVVAAQNALLGARQAALAIVQSRLLASVSLVQALGGAW